MPQSQDAILLREAVTAAKVGNKAAARQLLRQASVHNANNELVWLWRASLSESPKEAIFYLGEVLRINPGNQKAAAWLEKCKGAVGADAGKAHPVPQSGSEPAAAATQTVTNIPAPGMVSSPPISNPAVSAPPMSTSTLAMSHNLARTAEGVGVHTVRPDMVAAPVGVARTAEPGNGNGSGASYSKPPDSGLRARPGVIPFGAAKGSPVQTPVSPAAPPPPPSPRWKCVFCGHAADNTQRRCPQCRAVTVLEDLKEIEKNEGVQEKLVREALGRLEVVPADKRAFEQNVALALGHLNVREATAALPYLKAAAQQRKNDWALMGILDQIQWRKVILVVDDSLTIRKALSGILEKNDYRVVTAEDGSQALNKLNEAVPDLVLLDITMPWMDGYEVCKTIKQKALTRKVPVIMLSGKDGLFDKVRGKMAGCNDYVTKPFDPDGLLKTIKKYLS